MGKQQIYNSGSVSCADCADNELYYLTDRQKGIQRVYQKKVMHSWYGIAPLDSARKDGAIDFYITRQVFLI